MIKRFIQNNFASFAAGSLTLSLASGWLCLGYIQDQQQKHHQQPASSVLNDTSTRIRSREEFRLQAMVENALQSTWKENLDNAFDAQERFMLPGRFNNNNKNQQGEDQPKFAQKIEQRCEELWKQQEKRQRQHQKRETQQQLEQNSDNTATVKENVKDETRFWK